MAANSVIYHRWISRCFQVMALAEEFLATIGSGSTAPPRTLKALRGEIKALTDESEQIGIHFDREELNGIARSALEAAERLRSAVEHTGLELEHPLKNFYDEFADIAEVFALSVDPQTSVDFVMAVEESKRGECVSWEQLRGWA